MARSLWPAGLARGGEHYQLTRKRPARARKLLRVTRQFAGASVAAARSVRRIELTAGQFAAAQRASRGVPKAAGAANPGRGAIIGGSVFARCGQANPAPRTVLRVRGHGADKDWQQDDAGGESGASTRGLFRERAKKFVRNHEPVQLLCRGRPRSDRARAAERLVWPRGRRPLSWPFRPGRRITQRRLYGHLRLSAENLRKSFLD